MTRDSPLGKSFTLRNRWGSNFFPRLKGNYYSNLPARRAGELGTFGAGYGKGGGGPKSVPEFLHCRDTSGPPLRGGYMGPDKEDGVTPGRLP